MQGFILGCVRLARPCSDFHALAALGGEKREVEGKYCNRGSHGRGQKGREGICSQGDITAIVLIYYKMQS